MWQYPPRSILVAVDFGDAAARALRIAQAMAARQDSAIAGGVVPPLGAEGV
jgi:hypothetical protein